MSADPQRTRVPASSDGSGAPVRRPGAFAEIGPTFRATRVVPVLSDLGLDRLPATTTLVGNRVRQALRTVAALALSAAACSDPAAPAEDRSSRVLDCANPIDILDEPPDSWSTILDVIALPGDRVLQRGRFDDELGRSFSKFGLVIRSDRVFTLSVAETSLPNALMGWNTGSDEPVASIDISGCSGVCETDYQPNCPLGKTGKWVAYPGGVWTIDPACVAVEVVTGDRMATAELPVGLECT